MRGKEAFGQSGAAAYRITPAYAGKSHEITIPRHRHEDHPRVCGEKLAQCGDLLRRVGSPPRMRGKVLPISVRLEQTRITPAYAGKRRFYQSIPTHRRDHPRVCGEKPSRFQRDSCVMGSPPRMRGKVIDKTYVIRRAGITPAYAGKRPR